LSGILTWIINIKCWSVSAWLLQTESLNSDGKITSSHLSVHHNSLIAQRTTTYDVRDPDPGFGQAEKCGGPKPINGITTRSIILLLPLLNALSMFMLFICDNMWSFWVEANLCKVFFFVCLYMHCLWRSSYQEGRWDPINRFRPSTFVCLSKTRIWISNVICRCPLCDQWVMVNWKVTARYFTISV
jgi:hypothetical protein